MLLTAYLIRRRQKMRKLKVGLLSIFHGNVPIGDLVNPFLTNVLILHSLKTRENQPFSRSITREHWSEIGQWNKQKEELEVK